MLPYAVSGPCLGQEPQDRRESTVNRLLPVLCGQPLSSRYRQIDGRTRLCRADLQIRGLGRVLLFLHVHRRVFTLVAVVAVVLFAAEIASVFAFDSRTEIDGVRVATDKEVYGIGQNVRVSLYLVNNLDYTIDWCTDSRNVHFRGPLSGRQGFGESILYTPNSRCGSIQPGSERLEATYDWRMLIPGVYTIEASMSTVGESSLYDLYRGTKTVLVLPIA